MHHYTLAGHFKTYTGKFEKNGTQFLKFCLGTPETNAAHLGQT
jgi:hypothetical protein